MRAAAKTHLLVAFRFGVWPGHWHRMQVGQGWISLGVGF